MVEEGLLRVPQQLLEILAADALGELVVVVRGQADHGQDLAGLRVHHDHDATLEPGPVHRPGHGLLGELLFLRVDREGQGVAGLGFAIRRQDLELASGRISLNGLLPVHAAERRFVGRLDARLADEVVRLIALVLDRLQRVGIDRAGIPDDLRHQRPVDVVPLRFDRDLDPGEREPLLGDDVGRLDRDVLGDPDEIEPGPGVAVDRDVDLRLLDPEQGGQPGHDLVALRERQVRGSDLDRIARFVRDELTAAPVEDQATGRWQRLRDGPVLLGTGLVDLAADELEVDEPGRETADPDQDRDPEDQEADELALARRSLVDDRRGYHATRSRSADRRRSAIAIGPTTAATAVL